MCKRDVTQSNYATTDCVTYNICLADPLPPKFAPPVSKEKHKIVDTRTLGTFKNHEEYDSLNETNSFKFILIEQVNAKAKELLEMGKGTSFESLIDATVTGATSFVTSLLLWVTTTYQALAV